MSIHLLDFIRNYLCNQGLLLPRIYNFYLIHLLPFAFMTPYSAVFVPEHPKSAIELSLTSLSPLSNGIGGDWAQFSASGFLEVNPDTLLLASILFDTDIEKEKQLLRRLLVLSRKSSNRSEAASISSMFYSVELRSPSFLDIKLGGVEEQKNIIKTSQPRGFQPDDAFIDFWSDSLLDPIGLR